MRICWNSPRRRLELFPAVMSVREEEEGGQDNAHEDLRTLSLQPHRNESEICDLVACQNCEKYSESQRAPLSPTSQPSKPTYRPSTSSQE